MMLARLAWRNVLRNRRRSILTLASTAISLAILTTMVAVYQGFFYGPDVSEAGALRLITRHRVALVQPLPISYLDWLKTVPGVVSMTAAVLSTQGWAWPGLHSAMSPAPMKVCGALASST